MDLLCPDWNQLKPSPKQAWAACERVPLTPLSIDALSLTLVVEDLRKSHSNGGALLAAFHLGSDSSFDWFASRNRLLEFDQLSIILSRQEVQQALPELNSKPFESASSGPTACTGSAHGGFEMAIPLLFDGQLAGQLNSGGAYAQRDKRGDGRKDKEAALKFCDALFGLRYSEISFYVSYRAWTPWFKGIAWDWTAVIFDRRLRHLWILAVTDTD